MFEASIRTLGQSKFELLEFVSQLDLLRLTAEFLSLSRYAGHGLGESVRKNSLGNKLFSGLYLAAESGRPQKYCLRSTPTPGPRIVPYPILFRQQKAIYVQQPIQAFGP